MARHAVVPSPSPCHARWLFQFSAAFAAFLLGCNSPGHGGQPADRGGTPNPADSTPAAIHPPAGNDRLLLTLHAKGAQIYECARDDQNAGRLAWKLKAPDATLYDDAGEKVGTHFKGPAWEARGSTVTAAKVADHPSPDGAIPWLLLKVSTNEGKGLLTGATYVQRVKTTGGLAPKAGADPDHLGQEARVEYTADYKFYGPPK